MSSGDETVGRFGKMNEAKQAFLRQATVTEEEQEAIFQSFSDKAVRRNFMKKVYGILSVQLTITVGFIAFFMFYISPSNHYFVQENQWLLWSSMGVSILVLFPMVCVRTLRVSFPINFFLLAIFTIAESICMAMVSTLYETDSVIMAAGATALIVFFLTIFAFQTKIDFTACRGALGCVLFVFIIFGIGMIFIPPSKTMDMVYGGLGALIFSVYLVYDTQMMMGGNHKFSVSPEEYIFAAIALYLDILNIFLYILRAMGQKK